jgi:hypothetical protein
MTLSWVKLSTKARHSHKLPWHSPLSCNAEVTVCEAQEMWVNFRLRAPNLSGFWGVCRGGRENRGAGWQAAAMSLGKVAMALLPHCIVRQGCRDARPALQFRDTEPERLSTSRRAHLATPNLGFQSRACLHRC